MVDFAIPEVAVMNVEEDIWYEINPLLRRRLGAVAVADGDKIYVVGGINTVGPAYVPLSSLEIGQLF